MGAHPRRLHQASGARRSGELPGYVVGPGPTDAPTPGGRDRDDDLLVAALEEVIYLLDTTGEAPVDVKLSQADSGVDMTLAMVNASSAPQVGAVPKAVSLNELHLSHGKHGGDAW